MRKIIISIFLILNFTISHSQKIEWMPWQEMAEKQKENAKKIFIDIYTDWCGWCKKMDASTFIDPQIAKVMNQYYYAVKLNAEMIDTIYHGGRPFFNINPTSRKGIHTLAASLLDGKMTYPSFVILDENYSRLNILTGFQNQSQLLGQLHFFGNNSYYLYQQYLDEVKAQQERQK